MRAHLNAFKALAQMPAVIAHTAARTAAATANTQHAGRPNMPGRLADEASPIFDMFI